MEACPETLSWSFRTHRKEGTCAPVCGCPKELLCKGIIGESVLFVGQDQREIEESNNHLRARNVSIQPSLNCIGRDIFSIEDECVMFDNIRYLAVV
nr:unnamed protein product [Callosobruchus analis]